VTYGTYLLLARIKNDNGKYKEAIERHLDWWTTGYNGERITYTPKGLAWLDQWGSLRYATTTAFLACVYSDWRTVIRKKQKLIWSLQEARRIMLWEAREEALLWVLEKIHRKGPITELLTVHGGQSDGASRTQACSLWCPCGRPDSTDNYTDDISNYTCNEVACDYNAGFVGLLAKMYKLYGGSPDPKLTV